MLPVGRRSTKGNFSANTGPLELQIGPNDSPTAGADQRKTGRSIKRKLPILGLESLV